MKSKRKPPAITGVHVIAAKLTFAVAYEEDGKVAKIKSYSTEDFPETQFDQYNVGAKAAELRQALLKELTKGPKK